MVANSKKRGFFRNTNKKKGFTLIELLSVIVILAIIALIATPLILNMIEDSKKESAKDSAYGYIKALENYSASSLLDNKKYPDLPNGNSVTLDQLSNIKVRGTKPSSVNLKIENGIVKNGILCINNYNIVYQDNIAMVEGKCNGNSNQDEHTINATVEDPESTEKKVIKVIYLDPTNLKNNCTKELSDKNLNANNTPTGIDTGCMKWYVYDDDGTYYKMISDHNVITTVAWNSSVNVSYEVEFNKLKNKWEVTPDIISVYEIAKIAGADTTFGFGTDPSKTHLFQINGNDNEMQSYNSNPADIKDYAWLTDYTYNCRIMGCNKDDSNSYEYYDTQREFNKKAYINGYWTKNSYNDNQNWWVNASYSRVEFLLKIDDYHAGIRPVIKIKKSLLKSQS